MQQPELREVLSAAELLQDVGVSLGAITFYKLSAEIGEGVEGTDIPIGEIVPTYGLKTFLDGTELGVRLSLHLEAAIGDVIVDAAASYKVDEVVRMSVATITEFANEVGIMALIPYIRQAVADLSQRVFGTPILMPMFQRGELSFSPDDAEQES